MSLTFQEFQLLLFIFLFDVPGTHHLSNKERYCLFLQFLRFTASFIPSLFFLCGFGIYQFTFLLIQLQHLPLYEDLNSTNLPLSIAYIF